MKPEINRSWLGFLVFSLILFLLDGVGWLNGIRGPVNKLVLPIRAKIYSAKVIELSVQPNPDEALLTAEISRLNQENERLRDLLGAPLSPGWQFVPADVVGVEEEQMTLGSGSLSGVEVNQTVMGYQRERINNGVVLGQVVSLDPWQSQVRLLLSPQLTVKAVTESGASGIVSGDEQEVWLSEVRQSDRLLTNELVMTAGGDGWLPGLVLGRIGEVIREDAAVFQRARLDLVIDPRNVTQVFVVSD